MLSFKGEVSYLNALSPRPAQEIILLEVTAAKSLFSIRANVCKEWFLFLMLLHLLG